MGGWEWINSVTDSVKRNSPDVTTPVYNAYEVSRDAAVHVDSAVRSKARVVHEYLSDDQNRTHLTRVVKSVSFNTALYFARSYGGGPIIDIVSRSVHDKKIDSKKEKIEVLEKRLAILAKELEATRKELKQAEIPKANISMGSKPEEDPHFCENTNQKPKDLIHIFMMNEFVGTKLFDKMIVPVAGRRKANPISNSDGHHE